MNETLEIPGTEATMHAREHQNIYLHQSPGRSKHQFKEFNDYQGQEIDFQREYQDYENQINHH